MTISFNPKIRNESCKLKNVMTETQSQEKTEIATTYITKILYRNSNDDIWYHDYQETT